MSENYDISADSFDKYLKTSKVYNLIQKVKKFSIENCSNERIFIVGGFIRDFLLQRENLDVDFILENDAIDFTSKLCEYLEIPEKNVKFYRNFHTATIPMITDDNEEIKIDFCTARKEIYPSPSVLPSVSIGTSIEDDLQRRGCFFYLFYLFIYLFIYFIYLFYLFIYFILFYLFIYFIYLLLLFIIL